MQIIKPSGKIVTDISSNVLELIERAGRVCYKSEAKITKTSATQFVRSLILRGHESVLEHYGFTVLFIVDRGVSHEIVRHRLASYSQESTRYCTYGGDKGVTYIDTGIKGPARRVWLKAMLAAEQAYTGLLTAGQTAQIARAVLPNALKTEIYMSANLREWRHFFKLRTAAAAHPQMREVAVPLLAECKRRIPVVFDDISTALSEAK